MANPSDTERFIQLLTESQNRLFAYVFSLVGDRNRAADIVQETNLVLWRKIDQFDGEKPFLPWAFTVARYQVLAFLRDQKRDRVLLDSELVESLSQGAERFAVGAEEIQLALAKCLQSLPEKSRDLINQRYFKSKTMSEIADSLERSTGSIKVAMVRARQQLAECVEKRMASEG